MLNLIYEKRTSKFPINVLYQKIICDEKLRIITYEKKEHNNNKNVSYIYSDDGYLSEVKIDTDDKYKFKFLKLNSNRMIIERSTHGVRENYDYDGNLLISSDGFCAGPDYEYSWYRKFIYKNNEYDHTEELTSNKNEPTINYNQPNPQKYEDIEIDEFYNEFINALMNGEVIVKSDFISKKINDSKVQIIIPLIAENLIFFHDISLAENYFQIQRDKLTNKERQIEFDRARAILKVAITYNATLECTSYTKEKLYFTLSFVDAKQADEFIHNVDKMVRSSIMK